MLRAVLDTNVVVSAALKPSGVPFRVQSGFLEGRWRLVASPEILAEYETVLSRSKFRLPATAVREAVARLRDAADIVFSDIPVRACSDPSDDKFLACCLAGGAGHLVTGNLRHFPSGTFQGVRIVSPADFLALFPFGV